MTLLSNKLPLIITLLFLTAPALAYKVKDINGKKLLIDLEGEKLFVGDTVISVDKTPSGPEILGSAKVLQVREKLAVAAISDGKFIIGKKVARKAADKPVETAAKAKTKEVAEPEYAEDEEIYESVQQRRERLKSSAEDGIVFRKDMTKVSLIGAFSSDKISAKQQDDTLPFPVEETVGMEGSGSGTGLAFDYPSKWGVTLRTVILSEKLSVYGLSANPNMCSGKTSQNCLVNVSYISLGGHLRFDYNISRLTLWAAGGAVFKSPTSRETTALRQEDLKLANALVASAGLDFAFNNRFFLPVAYEYHYSLNKSDTVPVINHTAFFVGLGAKF
jgi:opacity protein-like surface antigen